MNTENKSGIVATGEPEAEQSNEPVCISQFASAEEFHQAHLQAVPESGGKPDAGHGNKIFIDGDFNDSYESRVRGSSVKKAQPIPVADAKRIAHERGYNQVVIIARRIGENGVEHVTTYGTDKSNCDVAAHIGNFLKHEVMKWEKEVVPPPSQAESETFISEDTLLMAYKKLLKRAITYLESPPDKRLIKECDAIIDEGKKLL